MRYKKLAILSVLIAVVGIAMFGCTSTGPQGWSGCASDGNKIFYGTLDSRIICINPESRASGIPFPDRDNGEWYYTLRGASAGGGMCGPMFGCMPASTGVVIYSTPAVSQELVYDATYAGKIYAFTTTTGSNRWVYPRESTETIGAIVGNILLENNNIYAASANGNVYSFDQNTGDRLWEFKTGDRIWTSPAYFNDNIYVGSYDGSLYSISAKNGTENWHVKFEASMASSPVVYKDKIIFGSFDRNLYAVSQIDGSIVWSFNGGNWFWSDPVIKDNYIFAACLDKNIYCINGDTGEKVWQYENGAVAAKPTIVGDNLAVASQGGDLYFIDINTGSLKQRVNIGYKVVAPLLAVDNTIYAHAMDDYIYAVDITEGKLMWKFKAVVE